MKWIGTEGDLFVNLDHVKQIFVTQALDRDSFCVNAHYEMTDYEPGKVLAVRKTKKEAIKYVKNILKDYLNHEMD